MLVLHELPTVIVLVEAPTCSESELLGGTWFGVSASPFLAYIGIHRKPVTYVILLQYGLETQLRALVMHHSAMSVIRF